MKRLFWSVGSGAFSFLFSIVISLLITPYLLQHLTRKEYAVFYLINNLFLWFNLLKAGQNGSLRYQLSLYAHRKRYLSILCSSLLAFYSIVSLLVFVLAGFLYLPIMQWIGWKDVYSAEIMFTYFILLINFLMLTVSFLFSSIISVYNREYTVNLVGLILMIIQAILCFVLLYFDYKLIALSLSGLIATSLGLMIYIGLVRTNVPALHINFQLVSSKMIRKSLGIGKWFFLGYLSMLLINNIDVLLIKEIVGISFVIPFLLTIKLYLVIIGLCQVVIKAVSPQLIRLYQSNRGMYERLSVVYLKLIFLSVLLIGGLIFIGNQYLLRYWVGESYFLGDRSNLLMFLMVVCVCVNRCLKSIVIARGEFKRVKLSNLQEGLTNLVLSIILGYFWQINGIILATLLASLINTSSYLFTISSLALGKHLYWDLKKLLTQMVIVFLLWQTTLMVFRELVSVTIVTYILFALTGLLLWILLAYKDIRKLLLLV